MRKLLILVFCLILCLNFTSCASESEVGVEARNYVSLRYLTSNEYRVEFGRLLNMADKIFYGEVISKSDNSEHFDAFYESSHHSSDLCFTDVNIKVLKIFKGELENEVTYRELGGKIGDTVYLNENTGPVAVGDKAVFFLTENNMLVGIESAGRFKETVDGYFYVDKDILIEGTYKANYLTRKKMTKKEFFAYLEEEISNCNNSTYKIEPEIIEITKLLDIDDLETIYRYTHTVVYGEVVEVNEAEIYDVTLSSGRMASYIKSDVKIKVTENIKGDSGDVVTYYQPGGTKNGVTQKFSAHESLNKGDKVIIFLTEGGVVLYEKGLYIVNEKGKISTPEGETEASAYVKYLKEEFSKIEEKIKEENNKKQHYWYNPDANSTCYAYNLFEIDNLGLLENSDVIICGKAEFGRKDIMYNPQSDGRNLGNCYTEVKLTDAKCFYNRYGSTNIKEISFLQNGGERDGVKFKGSGYGIKESEVENSDGQVFVFLKYDGANYKVQYLLQVKEGGEINPIATLVPKDYRDKFEEKTAENYGKIVAEFLKENE